MTTIPMRGGPGALLFACELGGLAARHEDVNRTLEEAWAGLLCVVRDAWPDWPLEVWSRLDPQEDEDGDESAWHLVYGVVFGGEGPDNPDVAAMADFAVRGLGKVVGVGLDASWGAIDPTWNPLWAVDDGQVYRLLASEPTAEPSLYLLGTYAGQPAWFAATLDAWPLEGKCLPVETADVDLGWASW